ncbi:hypothetical protein EDC04DRAFT_2587731, partial [Pisolithus marmoratus]
NAKSAWNSAVIDILAQELKSKCTKEAWLITRSDAYLCNMIVNHYKWLRTTWKNTQPRLTDIGTLETPAETEACLLMQREQVLKETWQTTCHHSIIPSIFFSCVD